ncbi:MAG TPA: glycosyltransferase family 2 protein [Desulfobulbaceae bacterium]|nr:glycosyltransferase family 2 protein [Desulfobulbaceae bacterium]
MISVIIPTYNRASYIVRAMDSVTRQTRPPDELIIVDDGSTDATSQHVAEATRRASFPVRILRQENKGPAAARNLGIKHARGDILCFLDSDDWWAKKKIALQLDQMIANPEILISHTKEIWFRGGVRVNQKKKHYPAGGYIFSACLKMCVVGMSTVMARRELFERYGFFDPELPCCEDYDLWLRVARERPFLLVNNPLTLKEGGRVDQLSRIHRMGMDRYRIQSLQNLLAGGLLSAEQYEKTLAELQRKCAIYGRGCVKHGREDEGEYYLSLPGRFVSESGHGLKKRSKK